jgi:hypothetical protein
MRGNSALKKQFLTQYSITLQGIEVIEIIQQLEFKRRKEVHSNASKDLFG